MSVRGAGIYYFLQSLGMEIIQFVSNGNKTFIALTFHTPNETFWAEVALEALLLFRESTDSGAN